MGNELLSFTVPPLSSIDPELDEVGTSAVSLLSS